MQFLNEMTVFGLSSRLLSSQGKLIIKEKEKMIYSANYTGGQDIHVQYNSSLYGVFFSL